MKTIKNMTADQLRKSILQLAIQGKLVKQDPKDEPASVLVDKIYEEKKKLIAEGKIKKEKVESRILKGDDNRYYEKIGKETKDITDELPFEIPESWEWIRLKNLSMYLYSGKTPKYTNIPNDNLIIGQAANNGIKIDYNFAKYGTNDFFECMPNFYFLKKYDVLLNTLGNGTIGRSGIFIDDKTNVLTDGHLFVMRNLYKETSFFLRYFLLLMRTEIEKSSTGTTNQIFLSMSTVGNYSIPLPPLHEQQRIIERIEQIEPLLQQYDKLEKQLTKLENEITDKLKKSILQYAIEGKLVKQDPNDEPASVLLERIKAEKEKLIKEGKIKRDKNECFIYQGDDKNYYEKLPIGWTFCKLNDLGIYKKGPFGSSLTKSMFVSAETQNAIKVYEQKNAIYKDCQLGNYYITYNKYLEMKSFEVFTNDFIVSCAGTIGEIYQLPQNSPKGIINQALMKITLYINDISEMFKILLGNALLSLSKEAKGTAIKNIPPFDILKNYIIMLPPLKEQSLIINKLNYLSNLLNV